MLKGLAITPPVLGRISIGKVIEKNGKRLPEKDDQFTITSQVQGKDGWLLHPLNDELRQGKDDKLRSIPVRLLFNEPELNFRADYTLFDRQSGRPVCVGNGETCKRVTQDGMQSLPCPSPDACPLAKGGACKPYGRLHIHLVGIGIAFEHRYLARRQFVLVLFNILRSDAEQWLLAGKGVGQKAGGIHRPGIRAQTTIPGGDSAIGIAGFFRAERSQSGAQLRGLLRRNRSANTS